MSFHAVGYFDTRAEADQFARDIGAGFSIQYGPAEVSRFSFTRWKDESFIGATVGLDQQDEAGQRQVDLGKNAWMVVIARS